VRQTAEDAGQFLPSAFARAEGEHGAAGGQAAAQRLANANDSQKASRKTAGTAQALWLRTNSTIVSVIPSTQVTSIDPLCIALVDKYHGARSRYQ
jgi:hypothetical protein